MSPVTGWRYPLSWVCEVFRISRSSVYAWRASGSARPMRLKRGPKTAWSDADVVAAIREVLKESSFLGEGHRKVTARLRQRGMRVGKNRVLRLMRRERLLAPVRQGRPHGDRSHSGTIITERPNELWGTDATRFYTRHNGWCWFFGAIDTAWATSSAGTWPRRAIAGRRWNRSGRGARAVP